MNNIKTDTIIRNMQVRTVHTRRMDYGHYLLIFFLSMSMQVYAGKLNDFEQKATTQHDTNVTYTVHSDTQDVDDECEHFPECIFTAIFIDIGRVVVSGAINALADGVTEMGHMSLAREKDFLVYPGIKPRKDTDPMLPQIRLDQQWQRIGKTIENYDVRIETGYGPYALQWRRANLYEKPESDTLIIDSWHFLYRMTLSNRINVGLGIGHSRMIGEYDSGALSMTFPINFHPNAHFGLEYRPAYAFYNGDMVRDHDIELIFRQRFASVGLGYRYLDVDTQSLNGPYIGFNLHW